MVERNERESSSAGGSAATSRLERIVDGALPGARILRVAAFKADSTVSDETIKAGGYGAPVRIDVTVGGRERSLVLHTATANEFGHDRRSDRARDVLLAADTFGAIPNHVEVLDVGAYRGEGFVSLAGTGEFYLLTTHAEGHPYAEDLRRVAREKRASADDVARVRALAEFLAELHAEKPHAPPAVYARSIRDTVGSGEGIFGIVDGYPGDVPGASAERLLRIEERCVSFRARLKRRAERLAKIHGDFHPFNVLFDERARLSVLDTSRGSAGDPADDVTCMAINFGFFALGHPGAWRVAFRSLWHEFWERYLALTNDHALYDVTAPFFAWRGLVLANPKWYPELRAEDRERILGFVERVLTAERFAPAMADEFFDS